ncbi:hypothetical protein DH2020_037181 [Rehmannia glutinosa]|uniref:tryptophan synthase n=1 Tax=Rehmannia glutinosa TaxID=99300 RepID=A0ABR0V1S9_REHGL
MGLVRHSPRQHIFRTYVIPVVSYTSGRVPLRSGKFRPFIETERDELFDRAYSTRSHCILPPRFTARPMQSACHVIETSNRVTYCWDDDNNAYLPDCVGVGSGRAGGSELLRLLFVFSGLSILSCSDNPHLRTEYCGSELISTNIPMAQSTFLSASVKPQLSFKGDEQWLGCFGPKKNPCHLRLLSNSNLAVRAAYTTDSRSIEIPRQWYNLISDLPVKPPPPLHPKTFEPIKPEDLSHLFPDELIKQEATNERFIDIPEEVIDVYRLWRPTPLIRAKRLEKLLDTPARIYYKYEGGSPAGSHKPNTAVPQVWYNAQQGVKNVVTETGAGQWGSSLAFACSLFDLNCEVWQVRASYDQKPYRKLMMQTWGAKVHPSPSNITEAGRKILENDPSSPGSLGIAISEAVEVAAKNADTKYCLGSVLNHVLLHQTVIGEECIKQMKAIGETPDVIIGCTGGGSNFGGLAFPFIREKLSGKINPLIRAVEPAACPRGLRYHGMAPLISHAHELGFMETLAIAQTECFAGAIQFARSEGLIPAPEPTHAIAATIREALHCRETGESKVILMAMCGHGHFDLPAYDKYLQGGLVDLSFSEERIKASLANIPQTGLKQTV